MKKTTLAIILGIVAFFLLKGCDFDLDFSRTSSGELIGNGKFTTDSGEKYYGARKYLLSDTPQKFPFPLGTIYGIWFHGANKTPFHIQYELGGPIVLSNQVEYIPVDKIYISRAPKSKGRQWVTLAHTKKINNKKN